MVVSTGFILLMQAGFALVENGTVRSKNSKNILIKNLFDACAGAITFYLVGYGFAFGLKCASACETEDAVKEGFIGRDLSYFAASGFNDAEENNFIVWCFQFSFAATSATIVSGSLAERCRLPAYFLFSILMTGFIYPVVVAWTWGGGWLAQLGFYDFAGTGIVHMVGGVAGFIGALIIRPRHGKETSLEDRQDVTQDPGYDELVRKFGDRAAVEAWIAELADDTDFENSSVPFMVYGTIILWVSWLFFNGGSTMDMFLDKQNGIAKIMMNTIISGAAGGLVAAFLKPWIMGSFSKMSRYDIGALANGLLAGLVAITGVCDSVDPWAALIIGILGGIVYSFAVKLCMIATVDDPIEASSVHGFTGMWGLIATGIFHNEKGLLAPDAEDRWGFFFVQLVGMIAIIAWVAILAGGFFFLLSKIGLLRVPLLEEVIGLDIAEMGSAIHISRTVED